MPSIKPEVKANPGVPPPKTMGVRKEITCKCGRIISVIPSRLATGELVQCLYCGHLFANLSEEASIWKPNQTK